MAIRVLVVEDSLTVRQRLCRAIASDPDLVLVGEVGDGARAIEACRMLRPDVIAMDMILPVMNGLAATEYIMAHYPTPILIVSSSFNRGELFCTYDALAAGAVDVLDKPRGDEPDGAWERGFVSTLKLVSRIRVITHPRAALDPTAGAAPRRPGRAGGGATPPRAASTGDPRGQPAARRTRTAPPERPTPASVATVTPPPERVTPTASIERGAPDGSAGGPWGNTPREIHRLAVAPATPIQVVAIGASTGGPGAVSEILRNLPPRFQLPILLVLHIGEPFAGALAEWLDGQSSRRVSHPRDGDLVSSAAGRVLLAPAGHHMVVRSGRIRLTRDAERNWCRPSVDVLFESIATGYGAAAAACLLTGMGRDGASGLLAIRSAGGFTISQDEASCIVFGMPREAELLDAVDRVLPLADIAPAVAALDPALRRG